MNKIETVDENCPICLGLLFIPKQCKICKNKFCSLCVQQWKNKSNVCPLRCSERWDTIDLLNIDQQLDEDIQISLQKDEAFLCPFDRTIGSLNCRTCSKKLNFEKVRLQQKYRCKNCNHKLQYFEKVQQNHQQCESNALFYFYCEECNIKMCDCFIKSINNSNNINLCQKYAV